MPRLASAIWEQSSSLDQIFNKQVVVKTPEDLKESKADALVLWGGEDIATGIYNQSPSPYTGAGYRMSHRDFLEVNLTNMAITMGLPIIGICRGAQLVCCIAGGSLIQHVNHHAGANHLIRDKDGMRILTNSVHHQMMNPFKVDHELIAWCPTNLSTVYVGDAGKDALSPEERVEFREPEIVWFPKIKALGVQGHPEFSSARPPFQKYVNDLVQKYIL